MAQPGKAPAPQGQAAEITITYANGEYDCQPPRVSIENGGQVDFNASTQACWVYTKPADAFSGENSGGYLTLNRGHNTFTVNNSSDNSVITYCACNVNPATPCTPESPRATSGGSVTVGNPPEGGGGKK